ncbi:hypothetical protein J2W28_004474 [Variovorax boronicumulans]|uniref:hypothetical protein n=1 Tax=Variovorax boronicumulans TaxID=436515 RepID=UPI00277E8724|nr:hypothetical protein [Variovorax boronicumulans]MDP9993823.1 hypothetical protein [Variovorax boronicumulans]MDQ0005312.1 hypothetical protein [Variovorax boronicumulans]
MLRRTFQKIRKIEKSREINGLWHIRARRTLFQNNKVTFSSVRSFHSGDTGIRTAEWHG